MPSRQALRRVGERPYRHDVWGPSYLVRRFGPQLSRAFLAGPLGTFSDALDTLTYYNQAYLSVLLAVDALYIDLEGNLVDGNKRSERDVLRNARRGIPRDFIENARQIGYTHSLHHVRPETLIEQLNPVEFKTQIDNFRLRLAAGDLPWDTASSGVNSLMTAVA
jgi:hypothetical protein